jgi:osmotically-inducible protein OsmY
MRSDRDIEEDVTRELGWAPDIDAKDVAVKVTDGLVTLTGFVRSYLERNTAEFAVKRVVGVAGIANDIEVRLAAHNAATDPEIAREALAAIKHALPLLCERIRVLVNQGRITLEGELEWHFQREAAERAICSLKGVVAVRNLICIKPCVGPAEIKHRIEDAFRRSAAVDADRITVDADGGEVVLRGRVRSWLERDEAQRTAWSAPGVYFVRNEITVGA